MFTLKLH